MRDSSAIYLFYLYHTVSLLSSLNYHQVSLRTCKSHRTQTFSLKPKWSDLFWSEVSLKSLHPGPVQTILLSGMSRCHTTPQRVRPTASSKSSVSLRTSFARIRRIPPSNTFAVLAVRYAKHQIDQKDSDTLWHDSVKTTKQASGTLLPPSTLRLVYLLYKLPNKPDGLLPSGTFTACCTSYRIGQTDFHPLTLLRLAVQATEQARRAFSGTFTACSIAKHQIGQTNFYPLTLDGSTIRNQLGLGGDHRYGLYTTQVLADV